MVKVQSKSIFTYKGPLALYAFYFALLAVSLGIAAFSMATGSIQFLPAGISGVLLSLALILYSTKIVRKINPSEWRENADTYYNDEGIFEYTHNGFALINRDRKSMNVTWADILRAESGENKDGLLKVSHIHLYLSESDFITVDSTMPGFSLFEKRLKENLRELWKKEQATFPEENASKEKSVKIS